ncbi:hypothetical protein M5K25_010888 [Dendrobium thyrsiflorum]|uniref:Uncharacterized protein n=1 Tax=Dendrobium thyrsiflorum TaxID=117978 RepID=A0ABD0V8I1_DENTH
MEAGVGRWRGGPSGHLEVGGLQALEVDGLAGVVAGVSEEVGGFGVGLVTGSQIGVESQGASYKYVIQTISKQLRLFDIRLRQTEIHSFGWKQESSETQSALINQAWSPDGLYVSSGTVDPMIHIFDIRYNGNSPSQSVQAHQKRVFKAIWHQSHPLMTTISSDLNIGVSASNPAVSSVLAVLKFSEQQTYMTSVRGNWLGNYHVTYFDPSFVFGLVLVNDLKDMLSVGWELWLSTRRFWVRVLRM